MYSLMKRWTPLVAAALVGIPSAAAADSWNERTALSFSAPVLVPGVTLTPGQYEFRLLESSSNRHLVQIRRQGSGEVVATTQAVPAKRKDMTGEVVLKFDPTDSGSPPAIRAWLYPGSLYGHQFTYPEEQARDIARRTKTVVLSIDQPGTDLEKGTLRTYAPTGERVQWHGDRETLREWDEWRKTRESESQSAASRDERRDATAAIIQAPFEGTRVSVDQLEEMPSRYVGKAVSVDAEVEDVLGPRLFTIDEPQWGDLEGEILVVMPSARAVLVREDDRITVSGAVKEFARSDVQGEWGWQAANAAAENRLAKRPVLVASRIVGGDSNRAMIIQKVDDTADGDTARTKTVVRDERPILEVAAIVSGDESLVGRPVRLEGVTVKMHARPKGFFVEHQGTSVFVLPTESSAPPAVGQRAAIRGVILQLPGGMDERLDAPEGTNDTIYVFATRVDGSQQRTES